MKPLRIYDSGWVGRPNFLKGCSPRLPSQQQQQQQQQQLQTEPNDNTSRTHFGTMYTLDVETKHLEIEQRLRFCAVQYSKDQERAQQETKPGKQELRERVY